MQLTQFTELTVTGEMNMTNIPPIYPENNIAINAPNHKIIPETEKKEGFFHNAVAPAFPVNTGALETTTKFVPGLSGNPKGRPKGARNKFTETFMRTLTEDFNASGADALSKLRERDPEVYFRLIISLLPKSLVLQYEESCSIDYDNLTEEEFIKLLDDLQRRKFMKNAIETVIK